MRPFEDWLARRQKGARTRTTCLQVVVGALFALSLAAPARADGCKVSVGYRVTQVAGRTVAVWYPTAAQPSEYHYTTSFSGTVAKDAAPANACGKPAPLVVFSHGYLGCGLQSVTFTEELARSGYVVASPDHADATFCHIVPMQHGVQRPKVTQPSILAPDHWDDSSRTDRRDDIEAIIAELLKSFEFGSVIDAQKIGLAGHSLGGYTVVGLAGGWQKWLDPRVHAVLALSPYVMPFQAKGTLGNVRVPLMYQGGTLDVGITPFLKGAKGAYAAANPPVYFVELRAASHLAWVNCGAARTTESCLAHNTNERLIADYGVAFFDRYLKELPAPTLDTKLNPALAEYDFKLAR